MDKKEVAEGWSGVNACQHNMLDVHLERKKKKPKDGIERYTNTDTYTKGEQRKRRSFA